MPDGSTHSGVRYAATRYGQRAGKVVEVGPAFDVVEAGETFEVGEVVGAFE